VLGDLPVSGSTTCEVMRLISINRPIAFPYVHNRNTSKYSLRLEFRSVALRIRRRSEVLVRAEVRMLNLIGEFLHALCV
jgi:hypothetical protein